MFDFQVERSKLFSAFLSCMPIIVNVIMKIDIQLSFTMADRLKQLREASGLSHEKLSSTLMATYGIKISSDSLKNYEVSDINHTKAFKNQGMRVEYLRYFADFYDVSTDYLLGLTDIKSPSVDTQAIVSDTGLTEENVERLKYFQSFPMTSHLKMANDFLSFLLDSRLSMDYLLMETTLNVPPIKNYKSLDSDGFVEQAIIEGQQRRHGYVQLSGKEAFLFYCSKIADRFEQLMIDKYKSNAKWEEPHGND